MKKVIWISFVLAVCTGCQTTTNTLNQQSAMAQNLEKAQEVVSICQSTMPDIAATQSAFRNAGYRLVESATMVRSGNDSIRLYQVKGWEVIAQLQSDDIDDRICTVRVDGMTPNEARELSQPWVNFIQGELLNENHRNVDAVWRGEAEGNPVVVVVYEQISTPKTQGAEIKLNYRVN